MAADHRLRVRQRFSGFYDLAVRQDGSAVDIDGSNFDADTYVSQLLKHKPLSELVERSNELSSEIKELDSDMQMLVYENYNKFICATDTIQQMKLKVDGMGKEMTQLAESVHDITTTSSNINSNLADRRVRIQKLSGVRRLLKKLSFIFELPTRLNRAVELDACAEAVKYWSTSLPVLKAYSTVPAFKAVQAESVLILDKLKDKLQERLKSPETSVDDLHEAAMLLLQLNEPASEVREKYLHVRRQRLDGLVSAQHSKHTASLDLADDNGPFSRKLLNEVKDLALSYHELFLAPSARSPATPSAAAAATSPKEGNVTSLGEGAKDNETLIKMVKDISGMHMAKVKDKLSHQNTEQDTANLVDRLELWYDAVRSIDAILPDAKVCAIADTIIDECGERRIIASFEGLRVSVTYALSQLCRGTERSANREQVEEEINKCFGEVTRTCTTTLSRLGALIATESHLMTRFRQPFSTRVHDGIRSLLSGWPQCFLSDKNDISRHTSLSLIMQSILWLRMRREGISVIMAAISVAAGDAAGAKLVDETVDKLQSKMLYIATSLIKRYAQARTSRMCGVLCNAMDVKGISEPSHARPVVKVLLNEIKATSDELALVIGDASFEEEGVAGREDKAGAGGWEGQDKTSDMNVDMDSMALTKEGILGAIVAMHLRTLVESIRVQTLSTAAYQQIMVDVHNLRGGIKGIVKGDRQIHHLLDELVANAADRCVKPQPMSAQQIHALCSQ